MKKHTNTPEMQFAPVLKELSLEDLEAIRRGEIIDPETTLQDEYDRRLNQAFSVFLLGILGTTVWFFLSIEGKLDITFWDVAQTFTPLIGSTIIALVMIYGPGRRLAEASLIPIIDPGVL